MAATITISPVTRLEGHLGIHLDVENGVVTSARCSGEMFRGFEVLLRGRHPMDAHQITQRICGVCPVAHGIASILAQEMAYGANPPPNGRILRNLIQGANFVQSHILHFYHLCALDFVDVAAILQYEGGDRELSALKTWVQSQLASNVAFPAAPFLPRYAAAYLADTTANAVAIKHYLEALDLREEAHRAAALFGGKMPHPTAMMPGGVTTQVTAERMAAYESIMRRLLQFVEKCYMPDVVAVANAFPEYFAMGKWRGNFLSFGVFPLSEGSGAQRAFPAGVLAGGTLSEVSVDSITEDVGYSYFSSQSGVAPATADTVPDPNKAQGYSWLKAPRYMGQPMEVGPLARMLVAYAKNDASVKPLVDGLLAALGRPPEDLNSVMGRHAVRAIEAKLVAEQCLAWVNELKPGAPTFTPFKVPPAGSGYGLWEAPRGALGHWIRVQDGRIANYQCVVPTTWNCSPRDDKGNPGPVEAALAGVAIADAANPIEAVRVVRSFDPCLACAVH